MLTHVVSISEIISKVQREGKDVEVAWRAITTSSKIVRIDEEDAKTAGITHAETKKRRPNFSLADAFVLSAARKLHTKILTGDPDFEGIPEAVMLHKP